MKRGIEVLTNAISVMGVFNYAMGLLAIALDGQRNHMLAIAVIGAICFFAEFVAALLSIVKAKMWIRGGMFWIIVTCIYFDYPGVAVRFYVGVMTVGFLAILAAKALRKYVYGRGRK